MPGGMAGATPRFAEPRPPASPNRHLRCVRLTLPRPSSPTGSLRAKCRHGSARARSGKPDSGRTRQLCLCSTPLPHCSADFADALARSDSRKLARPSRIIRARPQRQDAKRSRGFARPQPALSARCSACRPRDRRKAARLRPAKATAVAVRPTGFRFAPLGNRSASLARPIRARHVAGRLRPARTGRAPDAQRAAASGLRLACDESEQFGFALARLTPRNLSAVPASGSSASLPGCHGAMLPGPDTTHIVRSLHSSLVPHLYSDSRRHSSLVSRFAAE